MSKQLTPEAFFDSLSLAHKLDSFLDGFRIEELHLFSYFSAFLYTYAGNSIGTWPHKYIVANRYPFSESLNEAIVRHLQNGLFEDEGSYFKISTRGSIEFDKFKDLPTFVEREKLLVAACTTSVLLPYSQTIRALLNEPDLVKHAALENKDWLEPDEFYGQFKEISDAVGIKGSDLIVPAVTWVNYLTARSEAGS